MSKNSVIALIAVLSFMTLMVVIALMALLTNTSLAAAGALAHRLQNQNLLLGGPNLEDWVWKGVYSHRF